MNYQKNLMLLILLFFISCGNQKHQNNYSSNNIKGTRQSPINIDSNLAVNTNKEFDIKYNMVQINDITNIGTTIKLTTVGDATLMYENTPYNLIQMHYHIDSEHTVNGVSFPMEMHFVHQQKDKFVVIGLLFKIGASNPIIQNIIENSPHNSGMGNVINQTFDLGMLYPAQKTFYSYDGSFTTPDFAETVKWIVMVDPVEISQEQFNQLYQLIQNTKNNRELQPLNDRVINLTAE
ncbi:MAG: carbonic anhydrase family protein [Brevinema sp.]